MKLKILESKIIYLNLLFFCCISIFSCEPKIKEIKVGSKKKIQLVGVNKTIDLINPNGKTIKERFLPPKGFYRTPENAESFAYYLQNLTLKPVSSLAKFYNGSYKSSEGVYCSVIDMEISNKDLQQCADAVMRLRGEYLFAQKRYSDIHFNFLSDGKPRYFTEYSKGNYSYPTFRKYMEWIFSYANTGSLFDEMISVSDVNSIKIGNVFVEKKKPYGHAVIVVDKVQNDNGKQYIILAQSYMPAQETQILINPNDAEISPWFEVKNSTLYTPEWTFEPHHLKKFKD